MSTELHYSRSPLTEAVIDLRVELPESIPLDALAELQSGQEAAYPKQQHMHQDQIEFAEGDKEPTANRQHTGFVLSSEDGRQVVQARLDGFSFSRLAPYENWDSFRTEAQRWWDIYRSATTPKSITRIAVRYINRIDIPLPVQELKDYLKTVPEVSEDLPMQELSGFFMQLHIPQKDIETKLILNIALVPSPPTVTDVVSILLDIDLFRSEGVPQAEEDIWAFFGQLRDRKNEIFEGCITDSTRKLIS